jgi:hypothetical protein
MLPRPSLADPGAIGGCTTSEPSRFFLGYIWTASALARNHPGLLAKSDPLDWRRKGLRATGGHQAGCRAISGPPPANNEARTPAAWMIMPYPGSRARDSLFTARATLSEQKWSTSRERRSGRSRLRFGLARQRLGARGASQGRPPHPSRLIVMRLETNTNELRAGRAVGRRTARRFAGRRVALVSSRSGARWERPPHGFAPRRREGARFGSPTHRQRYQTAPRSRRN